MNRKIKNAREKTYDGIHFKSLLEITVYKTLKEYGFKPQYEKRKFIIWKGFKPTVPFYNRKKNKVFAQETAKL